VQKAILDSLAPRRPWRQVVPHYSLASKCPPGQESCVKSGRVKTSCTLFTLWVITIMHKKQK